MLLKPALLLLLAAARGEHWTQQCDDGERNVAVTVKMASRAYLYVEMDIEAVEFDITDACADDGVVLAYKNKTDHSNTASRTEYRHEFCLPATRRWRLRYHDDYGDSSYFSGASEFVFAEKEYGRQVTGGAPLRSTSDRRVKDMTFEVGRVCENTIAPTTDRFPSDLPSISPTIAPTKGPTAHPTYPPHHKTPEEISFYLFQFRFTYKPEEVCAPVSQPKRMPGGWPSECALSCAHLTSCAGFEVFDPPVVDGEGCVIAKVGSNYECREGEVPNAFFYRRDVSMHFGDDLVQD